MDRDDHDRRLAPRGGTLSLGLIGIGVLVGAGLALYERTTRNSVAHRPRDMAPPRARRQDGRALLRRERAVVGRTVTIARPRPELYAAWADFSNLPRVMDHLLAAERDGEIVGWIVDAPMGELRLETRIVEERPDEVLVWASTAASDIETRGHVIFRDAPAGRGTEVEAEIAYRPPGGEIGRWVATVLRAEPKLQSRRALKRFKMLMETGEIATNRNRKSA
jgi:uncharacterized membrane protein